MHKQAPTQAHKYTSEYVRIYVYMPVRENKHIEICFAQDLDQVDPISTIFYKCLTKIAIF